MRGKPKDVDGECNSHLYIGDDYGDNTDTMRCQLPKGHDGLHREEFARGGGKVVVTWEKDEREEAEKEEAYGKALGAFECADSAYYSAYYHVNWWRLCRSCAHWSGDRSILWNKGWEPLFGLCGNQNCSHYGQKTQSELDGDECPDWLSFDPETARQLQDIDRKFGKDYHK